jgi:transposase
LTYEELQLENQGLKDRIAILQQQIAWFKRQLFGRKSEKFDHPDLFTGQKAENPDPTEAEKPVEIPASEKPKKEKRARRIRKNRLPENLPIRTKEIIPEIVQANPEAYRACGFEEKIQLEKEPGYFYLNRILRMKFVPIDHPLSPPIIEAAKPTIIEGGFLGPGLLAEILTNKFIYHLPFDRQHVLNKQRYGIDISPNTMGDAAAKVADQCGLLVELMKRHMLESHYVRADETYIRYLDKSIPKGSARGYFWVYRGLTGEVIFDWQTSREHRHVSDWLGPEYEGVLQSDGYQAYLNYCLAQLAKDKIVLRAACLSHIRRKFENARAERPAVIDWILRIIARLYVIEKQLREHKADATVRLRVRQNCSRPLIDLLGKAFKRLISSRIRPKSGLGKALQYAIGQWPAMQTFLGDGRVEIDNNDTENDIRPSAVGKKNWLFVGSPEAGKQAAVMYTLLISARNHGVDPQAYLKDIIECLPVTRPNELEALLPANWAATHRESHPAMKSGSTQAA